MKIGALFAGYGGLELGIERVFGARTVWVSELDAAPSRILAHRFPDAPNLGDVTKIPWADVEPVDILGGGSPCQDLSHAGKRAGMKAGTRSGLWASMCDAIETIRPRLVVWENVRGALSASADSAVEPCPICVGDGRGVTLRALGRVLGDLAELGYDAAWVGLRAADVGAPHGRFRVFVLAWPAEDSDRAARGERRLAAPGQAEGGRSRSDVGGRGGAPAASVALLPTPAVNDMGRAYTPDEWDAWTARMKSAHGNGNGHGKSLEIEAQRLLPTPKATNNENRSSDWANGPNLGEALGVVNGGNHAVSTEAGPGEVLRGLRSADAAEAVREATRGPNAVPLAPDVLAELWEHEVGGHEGRAPLARAEAPGGLVRGVWDDDPAARSPHRPESGKQRPVEPADALRVVSPALALAGGPRGACGCDAWGQYAPAIHRWELILERPAPLPTEPTGKNGAHRLSARAVEFMMGLPDGWVTDTDTTRNEQLKALGNGVVPQQAEAALRHLLAIREAALRSEVAA